MNAHSAVEVSNETFVEVVAALERGLSSLPPEARPDLLQVFARFHPVERRHRRVFDYIGIGLGIVMMGAGFFYLGITPDEERWVFYLPPLTGIMLTVAATFSARGDNISFDEFMRGFRGLAGLEYGEAKNK